ncbi:thioredoxin family protein [Ammoniphilus resinae]|uniref:Thioredoxin domain-containing protein n=1 Tax=Ammoniphilus resinae TaxID=861532 RepID=A0ABS4GKT5_9BACL|nr:thioredoxin family protein [Ammoniphilus resinae]MBP1930881.1 hypothetical protein [Ammoniphilus resinae]
MKELRKILLFTLSACPMGRSIGTVLTEIGDQYPEFEIERVYVEIQTDMANRYKVKTNPTTVFLNPMGEELYRFEGFKETEEILQIIEGIESVQWVGSPILDENRESIEEYTVYLWKENATVPVQILYRNLTSIKAPRITAIRCLLQYQKEGYENPFPFGTELELVQFKDGQGQIDLKVKQKVNEQTVEMMHLCLQKTLQHFGVNEVKMSLL